MNNNVRLDNVRVMAMLKRWTWVKPSGAQTDPIVLRVSISRNSAFPIKSSIPRSADTVITQASLSINVRYQQKKAATIVSEQKQFVILVQQNASIALGIAYQQEVGRRMVLGETEISTATKYSCQLNKLHQNLDLPSSALCFNPFFLFQRSNRLLDINGFYCKIRKETNSH